MHKQLSAGHGLPWLEFAIISVTKHKQPYHSAPAFHKTDLRLQIAIVLAACKLLAIPLVAYKPLVNSQVAHKQQVKQLAAYRRMVAHKPQGKQLTAGLACKRQVMQLAACRPWEKMAFQIRSSVRNRLVLHMNFVDALAFVSRLPWAGTILLNLAVFHC